MVVGQNESSIEMLLDRALAASAVAIEIRATLRLFDDGHVDGVVREQDFADVAEQDAGCRHVIR